MKELIVTDSTYLANSLAMHILHTKNDVDLLVNKSIIGRDINVNYAKSKYSGRVKNIYENILPIDYCYRGCQTSDWFKLKTSIKSLLHSMATKNILKIIKNGDYDFIYLNNLILHNLISEDYPTIIHVRELYNRLNPKVIEDLKKATGVIFIDNYVETPFINTPLKHSIVLNNPFDMVKSNKNIYDIVNINHIDDKTIFAFIGRIEPEKGVSFIINTFKETTSPQSRLVIIGGGDLNYVSYCKSLAQSDPRIIFTGAIEDIQVVYDWADYIIRGEIAQSGGRTVYEGLYSGCGVIVPGTNIERFFDYYKFKQNIHLYIPRDTKDLLRQFKTLENTKITNREYISNINEYIERFDNFITESLTTHQ
jgi:glycosyltransferase involved in cell wall biosynthesis